jgi:hypothetical protein
VTTAPSRLRELQLRRDYEPASRPRETFYVPCLRVASRYDRFAGYFRAASLEAVADEGLQAFFARKGRIRIVVDAELTQADVDEVRRGAAVGGDEALRIAVQEQVERAVLRAELPGSERLSLVATLVAAGQMQVKVAVMEGLDGMPLPPEHPARKVFHDKIGILWDDEEDAVAFRGSLNETPAGWARNYEGFSVYPSWDLTVWDSYGAPLVERFEQAWSDNRADRWRLFDLPDPAVDKLLKFADPDRDWEHHEFDDPGDRVVEPLADPSPSEVQRPPTLPVGGEQAAKRLAEIREERWSGLRTAAVTPWPHQDATARAVADALWPEQGAGEFGRMFASEVGLGKTIEVGLVVREALSNREVGRVLVLAPASVAPQWQGEMWEKFSLWIPLLDRANRLVWPDGRAEAVHRDPWRSNDLLIASSHLARLSQHRDRVIDAGWDLLVVDEAHHGRRAEASRPGSANLLLRLLRQARESAPVRRLLLATATPMQMHMHEAWELLNVLGLPEAWSAEAFEDYWQQLAADRPDDRRAWARLQVLLAATIDRWGIDQSVEPALEARVGFVDAAEIASWHDAADPEKAASWPRAKREALVWWLSEQTPLRHLVHRSTRELLRHYKDEGIIGHDVVIPDRDADEVLVHLGPDEQRLYDRVETWISRHYQAAQDAKKPAHGFVMTTYRRRLTSSLQAIRISLDRRADALVARRDDAQHSLDLAALLDGDDLNVIEDTNDTYVAPDLVEEIAGVDDELAEVREFLNDIDTVLDAGGGKDSKYRRFEQLLRETIYRGVHRTCIVFTQYTDTMIWLRDQLAASLGVEAIATYSGQGGQLPDGAGGWHGASKGEVTAAFRDAATNPANPLKILLGTDSMSEGLNLQTCDLLINYDLPWNFMRVEQRIGRIDRIGGSPVAHVRNLLIVGTVEERVYRGIVDDHDTFGTVIGPTGKVTGDPSLVLSATEAAITGCVLGGDEVGDALEQMRKAAREARARALTTGTFDNSALGEHDPADGPWSFDRDGILDRIREALTPALPHPSEAGYWTVVTDHDGVRQVVFDPGRASDDPGLSLLVWGNPAYDAVLNVLTGEGATTPRAPSTETASSGDAPDPNSRARRPSPDVARVMPFADVPCHLASPLALQCVWSPNGMFVRVYLANLSATDLQDMRITAKTAAGQPLQLQAAEDSDLTAIPAGGYIAMGVRSVDDEPHDLPLQIAVAGDGGLQTVFEDVEPERAEHYV